MSNELPRDGALAPVAAASEPAKPPAASTQSRPAGHSAILRLALVFLGSLAACIVAYLAVAVPGPWFPSSSAVAYGASDLQASRGTVQRMGDELIVTATDSAGLAIVSLASDLRSSDFAAIACVGIDFPDDAQLTLLWQSDYFPGAVNSLPVKVESGRPLLVSVIDNPKWIGRIKGLALAVRGTLSRPMIVRGVVAKPMGAVDVLGDRAREWLAFEGWTGTSIHTLIGGADVQSLPLPPLLAAAAAFAAAALALLRRWRPRAVPANVLVATAGFFLVAWWMLDVRWTVNLARQVAATHERYGGKSWEEKRIAHDDGALFAFVQKARAVMPATPVRIVVAADAHYFRGRAAYHLYPHSVWFDPRANVMPAATTFKPGDWLLVYQRRGIQYNAAQQRLRWDDTQTLAGELKLAGEGAALFEIR